MPPRKRSAEYVATLIHVDEPQLLLLKSKTVHLLALAVNSPDPRRADFIAVTVTPKNLEFYFDGNVDLRYVFNYPAHLLRYKFDLMTMVDGTVMLEPFPAVFPEEYLPLPRLFASEHTTEYAVPKRASDEEHLIIDGEWDMPEFGQFYQRYSDVYSFVTATSNYENDNNSRASHAKIESIFRDKPFQGGFSYVHFFENLNDNLLREERLGLDSIKYASPGDVNIHGDGKIMDETREFLERYQKNRGDIRAGYGNLHKYLSRNKFLAMHGDDFAAAPVVQDVIRQQTEDLCAFLGIDNFETILVLTRGNLLVAAKIVLSFCRRVEEAASYFAQGRMTFKPA